MNSSITTFASIAPACRGRNAHSARTRMRVIVSPSCVFYGSADRERRLVGAAEGHAAEHRLQRPEVRLARALVVARVDELDRSLHQLDDAAVGGRAELQRAELR